jgi:hypothetical protein
VKEATLGFESEIEKKKTHVGLLMFLALDFII